MKNNKTIFLLFLCLSISSLAQAQSRPNCSSSVVDNDGDGWGYENGRSCLITSNSNSGSYPTCSSAIQDNDGDGWGYENGRSCKFDGGSDSNQNTSSHPSCSSAIQDDNGDGWGYENGKSCKFDGDEPPVGYATGSPVARHGQLSVCRQNGFYSICNQFGQQVQLTGMSSHGIQWSGWDSNEVTHDRDGCLTEKSMDLLANTWKTDIIRIAMYADWRGYKSDPEGFINHVNKIIDEATERGMYALVDFHILSDGNQGISGNPLHYLSDAKYFFRRIVQRNKNKNNVLYEIANEPQGSNLTWADIRSYGDDVVAEIRSHENPSNPAIVIVGTNGWSSFGMANNGSHMDIVNDPVTDSANNLMYAFHFYANDPSHYNARFNSSLGRDISYKDALNEAASLIPVFVTEWGTQHASGGGSNNFSRAQEFVDVMKNKKISWAMWNFSDTDEESAVWESSSFCSRDTDWTNTNNLSATGRYIKGVFDSQ